MSLRISVPDPDWLDRLADLDDVEVVEWDTVGPQPEGRLDLVLWSYTVDPAGLAAIDPARIGVVQSQALGYDGVADVLPTGGVYANAVGVHEGSTAELALALVLAAQRDVDRYARQQVEERWERHWSPGLQDRRVLLVGVGGIGGELSSRVQGFGAEVVRVGTRARDDERGHVHATDELPDLLPTADVVVLAVPLTEDTTGLVDADFLAALPDGALVVNVSRGKVVVTDAVVAEGGRIRFASDVFDPEPLPADHPLWTTPGVLVTPHVGGLTTTMRSRVERLVRAQVERLRAGQEPADVVVRT